MILLARLAVVVGFILSSLIMKQEQNNMNLQWGVNLGNLCLHLLLLMALWRLPRLTTQFHSIIIPLSYFITLLDIIKDQSMYPRNLMNLTLFQIAGFLISSNWMISGLAIFLNAIGFTVVAIVKLKITDPQIYLLVIVHAIFFVYACYH